MFDVKKLSEQLNGNNFIIGVSGGIDSIFLLDLVIKNREFLPNFKVVHVNHQISKNSNDWEYSVKQYCIVNDVEFLSHRVDIGSGNLENQARIARYTVFSNQPEKFILLAHHKNDQAETFFLKCFQGSSVKGLAGMQYSCLSWMNKNQTIIRPLLFTSKKEILKYAETHNLNWVEDESNQDINFDRNWIRKILIPLIENKFTNASKNIHLVMEHLCEAHELHVELAKIDENTVMAHDYIIWNKLIELSEIRIKNFFRYFLSKNGVYGYSMKQMNDFCGSLKKGTMDTRNEMVVGQHRLHKIGNKIFFK